MTLSHSTDDGTVTVRKDDVTLVRYRADTAASKPHVDTVALLPSADELAGRNLVLAAPHDHQWHLGLFFCQKLVDGVNCWESELYEAQGRPHGFAEHVDHDVTKREDAVTISQDAHWRTDAGERLLADTRSVTVHEPSDGGYLLTWEQELEATGSDRHLSSETLHGHYSGLSVRFQRSMTNGRVLLASRGGADVASESGGAEAAETDPVDPTETTGPRSEWCDYSGGIDGRVGTTDGWSAGVTLMDHPDNDHHPVRWFTASEPFGFVAANPTFETVLSLPEGDSLSWQWGAWVHEGTPERDVIEAAYSEFVDVV